MANGAPGATQRAASKFISFENFEQLNTQEARNSLNESELAWVENLQPLASNDWTTVPGIAASIASFSRTVNVVFFGAINVAGSGLTDFAIVFTTSGACFAVSIPNGAGTLIANDGTFSLAPDVTTWQQERFLFNDSICGYASWDGTTFARQGGVSANIQLTNGGSGYTTAPTVTIGGGSGSGATAVATIG